MGGTVLPFKSAMPGPAINDKDSRLALELAMDIADMKDILSRHDITAQELKTKLDNPAFRNMVKEFKSWWNSELTVKERIRLKSMVLVEDSLLELYAIFHNKDNTAASRLEAFKSLAKVATVDTPDKEGAAAGERVHISINIPGTEKAITYEAEVLHEDEREAIPHSA